MRENLCNNPENITREIRNILIYDADSLSFNDNLNGIYPNAENYLFKFRVATLNDYHRSVTMKIKNKNDYFKINLSFSFIDLTLENRELLYKLHRRKKFAIVTESNMETSVLGNSREPLTITINDKVKDNGSGKDVFKIDITGETTIFPITRKITKPFRVLLFAPPLK